MSVQKVQRSNVTGLEGLAGLSSSGKMKDVEVQDQDKDSFGTVMETQVAPRPRIKEIKEEDKRSSREQEEESEASVEEAPEQGPVLTAGKAREEETDDASEEGDREAEEIAAVQTANSGVRESELTLEEILNMVLVAPLAHNPEKTGEPAAFREVQDTNGEVSGAPAELLSDLEEPEDIFRRAAPNVVPGRKTADLSDRGARELLKDSSKILPEDAAGDQEREDINPLLKISFGTVVEEQGLKAVVVENLGASLPVSRLERRNHQTNLSETLPVEDRPQGAGRVAGDVTPAMSAGRAPLMVRTEEQRALQKQVMEALRASMTANDRQVSVRLDPPEWGHLQVRLSIEKSEVHVQFFAEKIFVGQELQRSLSDLRENLAQQGFHLGQVSVNVGDRQDWREALQKEPDEVPGIAGVTLKKPAPLTVPRAQWADPRSSVVDRRI